MRFRVVKKAVHPCPTKAKVTAQLAHTDLREAVPPAAKPHAAQSLQNPYGRYYTKEKAFSDLVRVPQPVGSGLDRSEKA